MNQLNKAASKKRQTYEISGVIPNLIGSLGLTDGYNGWTVVLKWPEIFADIDRAGAHAARYDDGVLFVAVADASLRQNLAMELEQMLRKIRSYPYGGSVKQIRFVRSEKG